MKKLIIGLILTISLAIISCASPETMSPDNQAAEPVQPPVAVPGLPGQQLTGRENVYSVQIDLVPSKIVYMPREQAEMDFVLTNASQGEVEPVIVSQLPPAISLVPRGVFLGPALPPGVEPSIKVGTPTKTFPAGTEEIKLLTGENVTYHVTWDQKDGEGNQVSPGWYYYEASFNFRPESSQDATGSGVRDRAFLIQYSQGVMQKTIEVNQSSTVIGLPLTVNGETKPVDVTITLSKIVLDEMGATFYAVMSSPNNPVSGYRSEWTGHIPKSSQYIVDGIVKEARAPNSQFLDSGINFRWGASADDLNYLDPVPSDAKQLTFVIPKIGDWEGPWEFEIQLQ